MVIIYNKILSKSFKLFKSIPSYNFKINPDKDLFNKKVCDAMIKQQSQTVLMCDGKYMRSTQACKEIGIKCNNITTIECDPKLSQSHKKRGVQSINMRAEELFVRPNNNKSYDTINLDVVSSPITISKYIASIFSKSYLSPKSVFAFTVTKRTGRTGGKFNPQFRQLKKKINSVSKEYGYKLKIHSTHSQKKVESIIYLVNKI